MYGGGEMIFAIGLALFVVAYGLEKLWLAINLRNIADAIRLYRGGSWFLGHMRLAKIIAAAMMLYSVCVFLWRYMP
jgi:multisubunit Na+/H+ antiporter MnhB subunit